MYFAQKERLSDIFNLFFGRESLILDLDTLTLKTPIPFVDAPKDGSLSVLQMIEDEFCIYVLFKEKSANPMDDLLVKLYETACYQRQPAERCRENKLKPIVSLLLCLEGEANESRTFDALSQEQRDMLQVNRLFVQGLSKERLQDCKTDVKYVLGGVQLAYQAEKLQAYLAETELTEEARQAVRDLTRID